MLALLRRNQILYEIGYFWGIVGTLNAVLTPQLDLGFPHYRFFQYFIVHGGIVVGVLFADVGAENASYPQRLVTRIPACQSLYGSYCGHQFVAEI